MGEMMKRIKTTNSVSLGKKSILFNGQKISINVYRDYESTFILVKGVRHKVNDIKENNKTKWVLVGGL